MVGRRNVESSGLSDSGIELELELKLESILEPPLTTS